MNNHKQNKVSFDDEMLILVDEEDQILGYKDKLSCHADSGIRHRAFSIFIFNEEGQVLMQKRSDQKQLWPLFWSNSCCSHPRKGEKMGQAVLRRLNEELGFKTDLKFVFKFKYQAAYEDVGSENEYCSVFIGKSSKAVETNINEIAEWKYIDPEELDSLLEDNPEEFTPWFKMEWERLRNEYWETIQEYLRR